MNREIKRQWIDALRSGDYKQNNSSLLKNKDGFDALGVLCDLHRRFSKKKGWEPKGKRHFTYHGMYYVLPECVIKWAGIPDTNWDPHQVGIMYKGVATTVAEIEDIYNLSFDEIADQIFRKL